MDNQVFFVENGESFEFLNSTGSDILAGTVFIVASVKLVTKETIENGAVGTVHFLGGPRPIWEITYDTGLGSAKHLFDSVTLSDGTTAVGFAVPDNRAAAVALSTSSTVSAAGNKFVRFIEHK